MIVDQKTDTKSAFATKANQSTLSAVHRFDHNLCVIKAVTSVFDTKWKFDQHECLTDSTDCSCGTIPDSPGLSNLSRDYLSWGVAQGSSMGSEVAQGSSIGHEIVWGSSPGLQDGRQAAQDFRVGQEAFQV